MDLRHIYIFLISLTLKQAFRFCLVLQIFVNQYLGENVFTKSFLDQDVNIDFVTSNTILILEYFVY